jgi:hypothetical protein
MPTITVSRADLSTEEVLRDGLGTVTTCYPA